MAQPQTSVTLPGGERQPAQHDVPSPSRNWPDRVDDAQVRIVPPPVVPESGGDSLLQLLFPVIGSVSLLGFALAYHNKLLLYLGFGMVALTLGFSLALRCPSAAAADVSPAANAAAATANTS